MKHQPSRLALALICLATATFAQLGILERLKFNNPEGTTYLKVGAWAYPLPIDFDGDGDLDLLVSGTDLPTPGFYFFENTTPPGTKEAFPIFEKPKLIFADRRGECTISTFKGKQVVMFPRRYSYNFHKDGYAKMESLPNPFDATGLQVRGHTWRFADYNGDGHEDLVIGVGDWKRYGWDNAYDKDGNWTNHPLHGYTYIALNTGNEQKLDYDKAFRLKLENGEDMDVWGNPMSMMHDWDNDGDLDVICGEFIDKFTYFQNIGTKTKPAFAKGQRLKTIDGGILAMDLQMITPNAIDWDGDGDLDIICGEEDGRVAFIENCGVKNNQPIFKKPRYFRQKMDFLEFGMLSTPCGYDWDGDGDWDLISGSSAGYIALIENLSGPGVESPKWAEPVLLEVDGTPIRIQAGENGSIQGPAEAKWGYTTLTVGDWDGDNLPDIIVNSILGDVVWFKNDGPRHSPKLRPPQPVQVQWETQQPELKWGWRKPKGNNLLTQWRTTPVMFDWNKDGLQDLIMLDQEGFLVLFQRKIENGKLVLMHPKRCLANSVGQPLQLNRGKAGGSGRIKLCIADWNNDGKEDIILNSSNAAIFLQTKTVGNLVHFAFAGAAAEKALAGHTTSPTVVDFNNDGILELIIGAEDGRFWKLIPNKRPPALQKTNLQLFTNQPITFNGTKPHIIPNSQKLIPENGNFSIKIQILAGPEARRGQQHIVSNLRGQQGRCELGIGYDHNSLGKPFWWQSNVIWLIGKTDITDGKWHTLELTKKDNIYTLLVDGTIEAQDTCYDYISTTQSGWAVGGPPDPHNRSQLFKLQATVKNLIIKTE
ncbi:MAG: VCBS repeat-containing protein [Lentisphaerae bacterium]|jgi:hypothetical protein|nr:VCBS repeat-containing protein [Lentisphaerota bacterium]